MDTPFRCRAVKPVESAWSEVRAESPEDAAQTFQMDHDDLCVSLDVHNDGGMHVARFCRVEVEGHGEMIARSFFTGIFRRGGVKPRAAMTIERVAAAIDWAGDPAELLAEGWDLEESHDAASARKWGR